MYLFVLPAALTLRLLVIKMPGVEQVVSCKQTPLVELMETPTSGDDDDNDNDDDEDEDE